MAINKKIYDINEIKKKISTIFKTCGVEKAYIFGSYARGEAGEDSDIDIIIKKGKIRTLFQIAELEQLLMNALGKQVDLITEETYIGEDGLNEESAELKNINDIFYNNIVKERIKIYG